VPVRAGVGRDARSQARQTWSRSWTRSMPTRSRACKIMGEIRDVQSDLNTRDGALAHLEHLVVAGHLLTKNRVVCRCRLPQRPGREGSLSPTQMPGADGPASRCRCRARRGRIVDPSRISPNASAATGIIGMSSEVFTKWRRYAGARPHLMGPRPSARTCHLSGRWAGWPGRDSCSTRAPAANGWPSWWRRSTRSGRDADAGIVHPHDGRQPEHWHTGAILAAPRRSMRWSRGRSRLVAPHDRQAGIKAGDPVRSALAAARGADCRAGRSVRTAWCSSRSPSSRRPPICSPPGARSVRENSRSILRRQG